jgi:phosphomannomutase
METSGVRFGTSGARGQVTDLTDRVAWAYTTGFLQYLRRKGLLPKPDPKIETDRRVAVAGDLRASTPRIMRAVFRAIEDAGAEPVNGGPVPSPAVALFGLQEKIPAIMVTGSHIPDDRNGIKFNTPEGEILKADEAAIRLEEVALPEFFDADDMLPESEAPKRILDERDQMKRRYLDRYLETFSPGCLEGFRLGLYEHSAVGRDLLAELYARLGAEVVSLGRCGTFLPVDTEAIRPEDEQLAAQWAAEGEYDAILSTDGDSDRPLVSDETGRWLRGDIAGILTAEYLQANCVVTPVSCNTALERCEQFEQTRRTKIGSPYVIAEMLEAVRSGQTRVVGYEANGGFLTATPLPVREKMLPPLPTRDPVIVHLAVLALAAQRGVPVSQLVRALPSRVTYSDRLQKFPAEASMERISALVDEGPQAIESVFPDMGRVESIDQTDGLRIQLSEGRILHLRPSGNAPELRCYTESDSFEDARDLNRQAVAILDTWRPR